MKNVLIVAGVVTGFFSYDQAQCDVTPGEGVVVVVPDDSPVVTGWRYGNGEFAVPSRTISSADVRAKLTLSERVKWDAGKLDEVVTVKIEFATPRSVADATELLAFLKDAAIISQISMDKVLS